MSAEVIQAFEAEAHRLDAEADNLGTEEQLSRDVKHEIARVLRNLAHRSQGKDPAAVAAEEEAGGAQSGLAVERTDESGKVIGPPDDAS